MSKNILTISQEDFKMSLPALSFGTLKQLIITISELTQGNISDESLKDLLRKETKIWAEMQRRGIMKPAQYDEFYKWRNKLAYKRKSFAGAKIINKDNLL